MEKISYFDLLDKIEDSVYAGSFDVPKRLRVSLVAGTSKIYIAEEDTDGTFLAYRLEKLKDEDENYNYYLANCYLESGMFDENIEIIDDEEPLISPDDLTYLDDDAITIGQVRDKINSIIKYIKTKDLKDNS